MSMRRIAVLMTSFNRCQFTLRALDRVYAQQAIDSLVIRVFLVDDGSKDKTTETVRAQFPAVSVLRGDGSLYWNRGMHKAFEAALVEGFDGYLFLNDDTMLAHDALRRLIDEFDAQEAEGTIAIVVGSTCSPVTGEHSYGGMKILRRGAKVEFIKIAPREDRPQFCDTMNGNIALIPSAVAQAVGNLDPRYHHHFGDLDYGLRARSAGFRIVIARGYLGECGNNSSSGTWRDTSLSLKKRWANLLSPKGQPPTEWARFTWRHYGWRWLHYLLSPYLKTIATSLFSATSAKS